MNRDQAIHVAKRTAKLYPPSYHNSTFEPHEWVIQALMTVDCPHIANHGDPDSIHLHLCDNCGEVVS